jgi:environmental stress-induced protein Ves
VTVRILPAAERVAVPWRNGGGLTREVAAEPPGAAEFAWRISVAEVAADGPFSGFAGYHRVIAVVAGAGMELTVDGVAHALRPHEPFAFDGAAATTCRLTGGPVTDLNVISRGRPRMEVLDVGPGEEIRIAVGAGPVVAVLLAGDAVADPGLGGAGRARLDPLDAVRLDAGDQATITSYRHDTVVAVVRPAA